MAATCARSLYHHQGLPISYQKYLLRLVPGLAWERKTLATEIGSLSLGVDNRRE